MRLIYLHGAPAVGKLTVGRALSVLTDVPLVDNHAAIDLARKALDFDRLGFWDLVHDLRLTTLRGLARAGLPRLIITSAYSHPADAPLVEDYAAVLRDHGGGIDPVYLHCSDATAIARVVAAERAQRGKIASAEGLRRYLSENAIAPLPHPACLHLSTEAAAPAETAAIIARHFALPTLS